MLKAYQEFINEQKDNDQDLIQLENFVHDIIDICENEGFLESFSYIAQNSFKGLRSTYDIDEILKKLINKYSNLDLKKLVDENSNLIYKIFDECKFRENGFSDIILNNYSKKFQLGGYDVKDDYDLFIKYLYGWHHNKYGMMAIQESFSTIEKFYEEVEKQINEEQQYNVNFNDVDKVVDNFIFGKNFKNKIDSHLKTNKDLYDDVAKIDSEITDQSMIILKYPKSDKNVKVNNDYIVDFLIKNNLTEYFSVFDLDVSHVNDKYVKKISQVPKTIKKYNI